MYSTEFDSGCLVCFIEIIHGRTPMRDTFVCMANNLGYQQELIVLSVLHTTREAEICNFSPLQKRDEEYSGLFLREFPPPLPEYLSIIPDPVNICLAGIQVFLGRTGSFSAPSGNRPMTLIRITGKGSVDSCF